MAAQVHARPVSLRPMQLADLQPRADEAAALLRVLANPHRLLILCALVEGERSVGQLQARLALSQSALSQHLARLREAGVVVTRRAAQPALLIFTSSRRKMKLSNLSFSSHHAAN